MNKKLENLYFGFQLSRLLKKNELSQAEALKMLNEITGKDTKRQQFNRWTTGETKPESQTIDKLASILNVPAVEFELFDLEEFGIEQSSAVEPWLGVSAPPEHHRAFQEYVRNEVISAELAKLKKNIEKSLTDLSKIVGYAEVEDKLHNGSHNKGSAGIFDYDLYINLKK